MKSEHRPELQLPETMSWQMHVSLGEPETPVRLLTTIFERLKMIESELDKNKVDTTQAFGYRCTASELAELLHEDNIFSFYMSLTKQYLQHNSNLREGWWINLHSVHDFFTSEVFYEELPTEQLVVGQEGKAVRFFNFGSAMNANRRQDCRVFVDVLTQFFGDITYELVSDVVITAFDPNKISAEEGWRTDGFVDNANVPGVIFVNSVLLDDNQQQQFEGVRQAFLETLFHETGHLLHGRADQLHGLLPFVAAVGWDVARLVAEQPHWQQTNSHANLEKYASHGKLPTECSRLDPTETFAEVTRLTLLGDAVACRDGTLRDAWLTYIQQRLSQLGVKAEDNIIATKLDRSPVIVERRTGAHILYPATLLPDTITVHMDIK